MHASFHDVILEFRSYHIQALRQFLEVNPGALTTKLKHLISDQYKFPNQIHKIIEQPNGNPDCAGIGTMIFSLHSQVPALTALNRNCRRIFIFHCYQCSFQFCLLRPLFGNTRLKLSYMMIV